MKKKQTKIAYKYIFNDKLKNEQKQILDLI